jgi:hypothetical protein
VVRSAAGVRLVSDETVDDGFSPVDLGDSVRVTRDAGAFPREDAAWESGAGVEDRADTGDREGAPEEVERVALVVLSERELTPAPRTAVAEGRTGCMPARAAELARRCSWRWRTPPGGVEAWFGKFGR